MRFLLLTLAATLCLGLTALAEDAVFDTPPAPLTAISPEYPEAARQAGIAGKVLVTIQITADGTASNPKVLQGVREDLDQAAINALKVVRWTPAQINGKPVACEIVVPIQFKLAKKDSTK
ncbi:MAG: energy transducer TonB [bacterium]|nr:energy transducer TonB [bacterium]